MRLDYSHVAADGAISLLHEACKNPFSARQHGRTGDPRVVTPALVVTPQADAPPLSLPDQLYLLLTHSTQVNRYTIMAAYPELRIAVAGFIAALGNQVKVVIGAV
jgi:hypothetical protein